MKANKKATIVGAIIARKVIISAIVSTAKVAVVTILVTLLQRREVMEIYE